MRRLAFSVLMLAICVSGAVVAAETEKQAKEPKKTVVVNGAAPEFKIKDSDGKLIDLKKLTEKGPVLVRLTCGCSGCDKELAYFQALHKEYKGKRPHQLGDLPRTRHQSREVRQAEKTEHAVCRRFPRATAGRRSRPRRCPPIS